MHCREFEARLNSVLDERGNPRADARLAAHGRECDACRRRLMEYEALVAGVRRLSTPLLTADFSQRVVAEVVEIESRSGHRLSRGWLAVGVLFASAALALIAVSLVWQIGINREANRRRPAAGSVADKGRPPARGLAVINRGIGSNRDDQRAVAFTQAALLLEAPRLPERLREYGGAIDEIAEAIPEMAEHLDRMERLAPGLRPIRRSIGVVSDTLGRALPRVEHRERPPTKDGTSLLVHDSSCLV
jgi:hypothetical protein